MKVKKSIRALLLGCILLTGGVLVSSTAVGQGTPDGVVYPPVGGTPYCEQSDKASECYVLNFYGLCGDGIVERKPWIGGAFNNPLYQEQCDIGPVSNKYEEKVKGGEPIKYGCYSPTWALGGCRVRKEMVGNGVIERYTMDINNRREIDWEDCDDGRLPSLDPLSVCEKWGRYRGSYDYPWNADPAVVKRYDNYNLPAPGRCGNGVLDSGEKCDAGSGSLLPLYHTKGACGGCSSAPNAKNSDGYECNNRILCGNGIVDRYAGEQCDDGSKNGKGASLCSEQCTWKTINPLFKRDRFIFKPVTSTTGMMDGNAGLSALGSLPLDPSKKDKKIYDILGRGRVVYLARDVGKQYSGIVPSGQSIKQEGGVDIEFTLRSADPNYPWDNDAFGLVFGVNEDVFKEGAVEPNYLMLRWRSSSNTIANAGDYTLVDASSSKCTSKIYAGSAEDRGLRLFHIKGRPDYNELWNMQNCGTDNSILHVPTQFYPGPKDKPNPPAPQMWRDNSRALALKNNVGGKPEVVWPSDENKVSGYTFNHIVNPAFTYNTYYLKDLYIYEDMNSQVLNIKAHFDAKGLTVYVNSQKVIDITSAEFKNELGREWPNSGEWGFYFLGMDNFVADFRSPQNRNNPTEWEDALRKRPIMSFSREAYSELPGVDAQGTRCDYCGDGKTQTYDGKEACDDANSVNGDGCETDCTLTPGWACDTTKEPAVCYFADITNPTDSETIATLTPVITGAWKGSAFDSLSPTPPELKVKIEDKTNSSVVCEGVATRDTNHQWEFATSSCSNTLADGNDYQVKLVVEEGGSTLELPANVSFRIDLTEPVWSITSPARDAKGNVYLKGEVFARSSYYNQIRGTLTCNNQASTGNAPKIKYRVEYLDSTGNLVWSNWFSSSQLQVSCVDVSDGSYQMGRGKHWALPVTEAVSHLTGLPTSCSSSSLRDCNAALKFEMKLVGNGSTPYESSTKTLNLVLDNVEPAGGVKPQSLDIVNRVTLEQVIGGKTINIEDGYIVYSSNGKLSFKGTVKNYEVTVRADQKSPLDSVVELKFEGRKVFEALAVPIHTDASSGAGNGSYEAEVALPPDMDFNDSYTVTIKVKDLAGNESTRLITSVKVVDLDSNLAGPKVTISPANNTFVSAGSLVDCSSGTGKCLNTVIRVLPAIADSNDLKVSYCQGETCTPGSKTACDANSYDVTSGVCKFQVPVTIGPSQDDVVVKIRANAEVNGTDYSAESKVNIEADRLDNATKPEIISPKSGTTVGLEHGRIPVKVSADSSNGYKEGDVVVVSVSEQVPGQNVVDEKVSSECNLTIEAATKLACTAYVVPVTHTGKLIATTANDNKVKIDAFVRSPSGKTESQKADPQENVKVNMPDISITDVSVEPGAKITLRGNSSNCSSPNCSVALRLCKKDTTVCKDISVIPDASGAWNAEILPSTTLGGVNVTEDGSYTVTPVAKYAPEPSKGLDAEEIPFADKHVDISLNGGGAPDNPSGTADDVPKFNSPCEEGSTRADGAICDPSKNIEDGKIVIDVKGPAGKKVKVKITDKEGNVVSLQPTPCPENYSALGKLECKVPVDTSKGPFTVKVTTVDNSGSPLGSRTVTGVGGSSGTTPGGPGTPGTDNTPKFNSPCLLGTTLPNGQLCDPSNNIGADPNNSTKGVIHIDVDGPANKGVKVKITDKNGTGVSSQPPCATAYNGQGKLKCDVTVDPQAGPFTVKVTTVDGNGKELGSNEVRDVAPPQGGGKPDNSTIDSNNVPKFNSPCEPGSFRADGSVCDPSKNIQGGKIVIDVNGPKSKPVKVDITDKNGNVVPSQPPCATTYNAQGKLKCEVPVDTSKGPFTVKVTTTEPSTGKKASRTVTGVGALPNQSSGGGIVTGGCSCSSTDSPASGLFSLLLAALGLVALRRRRDD